MATKWSAPEAGDLGQIEERTKKQIQRKDRRIIEELERRGMGPEIIKCRAPKTRRRTKADIIPKEFIQAAEKPEEPEPSAEESKPRIDLGSVFNSINVEITNPDELPMTSQWFVTTIYSALLRPLPAHARLQCANLMVANKDIHWYVGGLASRMGTQVMRWGSGFKFALAYMTLINSFRLNLIKTPSNEQRQQSAPAGPPNPSPAPGPPAVATTPDPAADRPIDVATGDSSSLGGVL